MQHTSGCFLGTVQSCCIGSVLSNCVPGGTDFMWCMDDIWNTSTMWNRCLRADCHYFGYSVHCTVCVYIMPHLMLGLWRRLAISTIMLFLNYTCKWNLVNYITIKTKTGFLMFHLLLSINYNSVTVTNVRSTTIYKRVTFTVIIRVSAIKMWIVKCL